MEEIKLSAGTALIDITPPIGSAINGDFVPHYATAVHDPLYAKAMVFKSGTTTLVLVIVDTCSLTAHFLDPVKHKITNRTGIPYEHILIAATHTHSAGSVTSVYLTPVDPVYAARLAEALLTVVDVAFRQQVPCTITCGSVSVAEHVVCRRYRMKQDVALFNPFGNADQVMTNPFGQEALIEARAGVEDPELSYLAVRSVEGEWLGILGNYSLHYVGDFSKGIISADYFGSFAQAIKQQLGAGDAFVAMLSNGTSGNINIWDFLLPDRYPAGPFEKGNLIAGELAAKIVTDLKGRSWQQEGLLEVVFEKLVLPIRKPSSQILEWARSLLPDGSDTEIKLTVDHKDLLVAVYAREQLLLAKEADYCTVPLQLIKIGPLLIGALPGEFFAETGLRLKAAMSARHYFSIGLANDKIGYVPPAEEMQKGGYETWQSRTSKMTISAEAIIRDHLIYMSKKI